MRPGVIAACVIAVIIVVKDPHIVNELVTAIANFLNSPGKG